MKTAENCGFGIGPSSGKELSGAGQKVEGEGGWAGGKWGVGQQVSSLRKGWVTPVFSQWWSGS